MGRPRERRRSREAAAFRARLRGISAGVAVGISLLKGCREDTAPSTRLEATIEIFESSLSDLRAVTGGPEPTRARPINLESMLQREAGRVGVALAFECVGEQAWLTEDETEMILLIGSEALRNVVRHSGSSRC